MRGGNRQQALRRKTEGIETGPIGRAAFGKRHVLGEPADVGLFARGEPQRKTRCCGEVGLARRRDFVQRAARQTTAERFVDRRDAERQDGRAVLDPGGFLQGLQALAQLLDHGIKPLETRRNPAKLGRLSVYHVHYLFQCDSSLWDRQAAREGDGGAGLAPRLAKRAGAGRSRCDSLKEKPGATTGLFNLHQPGLGRLIEDRSGARRRSSLNRGRSRLSGSLRARVVAVPVVLLSRPFDTFRTYRRHRRRSNR
jgi:hypothetical protein